MLKNNNFNGQKTLSQNLGKSKTCRSGSTISSNPTITNVGGDNFPLTRQRV